MKYLLAGILVPVALAIVGTTLIVWWVCTGPLVDIQARGPGLDGAPAALATVAVERPVQGEPVRGDGHPSKITAVWPWFRGMQLDAIGKENVRLARKWPADGPRRLWTVPLGEGYAAPVVRDGCVYVLDHVHDAPIDLLRTLKDEERTLLADTLAHVVPDDMKRAAGVLAQLFPKQQPGAGEGSPGITQAEFDALVATLRNLLSQERDKLLRALRNNTLDAVDHSADTMRCLSLDDGRELWHNGYRVVISHNHGISRTIPAVVGDSVISLGPKCQVACWEAASGKGRWLMDLVADHGASVPTWYAGQCPLIDTKTDRLIVAPGGKALVMAVDYHTGKILWQSPNPRGWTMTHVSITPTEFAGRRQYIYCGKGGVAGIAADSGEILWDTTDWQIGMATCPTPVVVGDGKIFFCGGYNAGALMLQLENSGGRVTPHTLFRLSAKQFGSEQQTPVFFGGHLYGVRQKDQQLVCLDLEGKELWNSGRDKFGSAPYMIADGLIYALNDDGVLTMAEATPQGYRRLARAEVIPEGVTSWGPMALVAGRLIVRDLTRMTCLDIAEH
jgi:outer membrane protein assembly factor BamB